MEGYIGYVTMFAGNFAPRSWAFCAGQILPISQNTALFSILGTTYGGNGQTTFALPDLRGRAAVSAGSAPGLRPFQLGEISGTTNTTMLFNEMPAHTHPVNGTIRPVAATNASTASPVGGVYANASEPIYNPASDSSMQAFNANLTTGLQGGGQPFPNQSPFLTVNYIICLQGIFPSRN